MKFSKPQTFLSLNFCRLLYAVPQKLATLLFLSMLLLKNFGKLFISQPYLIVCIYIHNYKGLQPHVHARSLNLCMYI